jgi:3-oxoacyl-[acyl-carrier-protein] synthase II
MSSNQQSNRQVVITGIGIASPLGMGVEPFWEHLSTGRSGIGPAEILTGTALPGNVAGEVTEFTKSTARKQYLKPQRKSIKVMCREIQLGIASASLAVENSGLDLDAIDHDRLGIEFGANLMFSPPDVLQDASWKCVDEGATDYNFHFDRWGKLGLPAMEPLWLLRYLPNMPGCHIGIAVDAHGPNNSITMDDASANLVLGEAYRIIQRGSADQMIAGTTGTRLHSVKSTHARFWDELAETPEPPATWCRPFDRDRTGQVAGEGACSFILEDSQIAADRKATVYGTVLGAGASCVADRDGTPRLREALAAAMQAALRDASLQPADIGHINAHGEASRKCDVQEAAAIRDIFGELAPTIPVTALKSYFGNSGSGCGTLELAGSLLGLQYGVVPATLNYTTPDPDCPLNIVHGESLAIENKVVLSINVTRMGQASALIVRGE